MGEQVDLDDETKATQLTVLPVSLGFSLSLHTILHCRTVLMWKY